MIPGRRIWNLSGAFSPLRQIDTKKKAAKILSNLIWEGNSPDSEALDAAGLKYFPLVEDIKEPYSCFIEKEHSEDAFGNRDGSSLE